jgi:hypothetical protein
MITATPFLAAAAEAKLVDWGPRLGRHLADPRDDPEALRPVLTGRARVGPGTEAEEIRVARL